MTRPSSLQAHLCQPVRIWRCPLSSDRDADFARCFKPLAWHRPRIKIPLPFFRISANHKPSRASKRGASRSSRVSGAGCGGRDHIVRRAMGSRTAKSCGPDSPTLESSLARRFAGRWWLTSPVHQGEREAAVKTIAQGMPGVSAALSLLACAKCTFFARKARGCSQHPAFPAPSCSSRTRIPARPGRFRAAGMRSRVFPAV
jgi:hypothetical protein